MHIPDGWVDLPTSAAAGAVAVGATAASGRRAAAALRDRATTLPAVVAAYVLVAQLLVLPLGFGTSAHLIGTGLAALLVGPDVAIVCVAVVVVFQALVLGDGGVTALGLNIVNDGIVPALATAGLFMLARPLVTRARTALARRRRAAVAAGVAAGAGALAAAATVTAEFVVGGTDAVPAHLVAASVGGAYLVLAALEGILTAVVVAAVLRLRPDMVRALRSPAPPAVPVAAAPTGGDR